MRARKDAYPYRLRCAYQRDQHHDEPLVNIKRALRVFGANFTLLALMRMAARRAPSAAARRLRTANCYS